MKEKIFIFTAYITDKMLKLEKIIDSRTQEILDIRNEQINDMKKFTDELHSFQEINKKLRKQIASLEQEQAQAQAIAHTNSVKNALICPITHDPIETPVVLTCDGYIYEKFAIEKWLIKNNTSPMTNKTIERGDKLTRLYPHFGI